MELACKRLKHSEELIEVPDVDRISNLPGNLIGHILSFLPTKYAVATSVLSKRWKNSWTLITTLEIDDQLLRSPEDIDSQLLQTSFVSFVYRVLRLVKSACLPKILFKCKKSYDISHVVSWITTVLKCSVEELDLSLCMENSPLLPWDLFFCRTLVELKLGENFVMNVPDVVCLPCLKSLSLNTVKFLDDESISRFLHGCPVLEQLRMRECIGEDVEVVNICCPALTRLDLVWLPYLEDKGEGFKYRIVLDTPLLSDFRIHDYVAEGYEIRNPQNLVTADIDVARTLEFGFSREPVEYEEIHREAYVELLQAISRVESLSFTGFAMEAITFSKCQLPAFPNVTELSLGANKYIRWQLLPLLLKNIPHLSSLEFIEGLGSREFDEQEQIYWQPPTEVPGCVVSHLKRVEVWNYEGTKDERVMVEYFLRNARVLKKLILHDSLLEVPRASRDCELELMF